MASKARSFVIGALVGVAGTAGAACSSTPAKDDQAASTKGPGAGPAAAIVTGDQRRGVAGCRPRRVGEHISSFFTAFNRGDQAVLARSIVPADTFQWYIVAEKGHRESRGFEAFGTRSSRADATGRDQRPEVLAYFARRHRQGERLRLLEAAVTRIRPRSWFPEIDETVAGVEFVLVRRARDLAQLGGSNRVSSGKGALDCRTGAVVAWTMGLDVSRTYPRRGRRLCPRRSRSGRARPVLCSL